MLTDATLQQILDRVPELTIGVVGDLFLDRYLEIAAELSEPSLETGLDAYQVTRVRSHAGAAGTVINNLAALGVKQVVALAVLGDDGEGHELRQAVADLRVVDSRCLFSVTDRSFRTPTYTKPMFHEEGRPPRELNRLDIKNRTPLPEIAEGQILQALAENWQSLDALIVLDQVSEANCGVITERVRQRIAQLGKAAPEKLILADSRARIGLFEHVSLKPNRSECLKAAGFSETDPQGLPAAALSLARQTQRPVFCTTGERGILLALPGTEEQVSQVPGFPVRGPIDIVGAGDSTSAGIACAVASGTSLAEAAAFGNLIASITIQQIGTTGTASPDQVRQRWLEVRSV
ncbi:MAG TPA: PfkB family carbohydrate kinase [Gemmataceae bacterium]|jgi:rfaE bifunctional protein kinase chain/domain|nr:PfkB family carbohydrate kinase [Gemmataceae bacterium]